jgi:hypothetical protein
MASAPVNPARKEIADSTAAAVINASPLVLMAVPILLQRRALAQPVTRHSTAARKSDGQEDGQDRSLQVASVGKRRPNAIGSTAVADTTSHAALTTEIQREVRADIRVAIAVASRCELD